VQLSVGRAAVAGGGMNGFMPTLLKASLISMRLASRCHGGSVTEDRLVTYWGCDGR